MPGNHVKTLTSASRLLKEYGFGKRHYHVNQMKLRGNPDLGKPVELMTTAEKAYHAKQEPNMAANELDGTIFVKAEWEGFGEQMPPARSETLICSAQNEKNRRQFSKTEQHQMLKEQKPLDVNDPRNELLLKEEQAQSLEKESKLKSRIITISVISLILIALTLLFLALNRRKLNQSRIRLEELDKVNKQIFSVIAHDFKEPIINFNF